MAFTKSAMQEQLHMFLSMFGKNMAALYGIDDSAWTEGSAVEHSPIWQAISEMYDYGVDGIPTEHLVPGIRINGIHAHVEAFFYGLNTRSMQTYLELDEIPLPRLAMLTVQSAVARMVLDGGDRYSDFGSTEYGTTNGDTGYLTLAEVALLANMDERSVRNAANPKLPNPLKTEQVGKRSLVTPEEARRWLDGRKGFVPTKKCEVSVTQVPEYDLELSPELVEVIEKKAKNAGLSFNAYLKQTMFRVFKEMEN